MENVVLVVHLILALALILVVLIQRSEGGGLGMGGGGGGNSGVVSSRGSATALTKVTWFLATAFICTSVALTVFATREQAGSSVIDRLGTDLPAGETGGGPLLPPGLDGNLLPPSTGDSPLLPPVSQ